MKIYEVVLSAPSEANPNGRVVEMKEMGTSDLLMAFRQSGEDVQSIQATNLKTKLAALRLCVVGLNGAPLKYSDLQGELWDKTFTLKETFRLVAVWSHIHEPEDDGLGGMVRVKSGV